MKKYWIILIVWYLVPLAIKLVFDFYSKQLFVAFYLIHQICICYIESSHLDQLNEYRKIYYPEFHNQKTGFLSRIYPFSILTALDSIDEEKKYITDEEYKYRAAKVKKWLLFHLLWFVLPAVFIVPYFG